MQAIGTEAAANLDGVADSVGGLYNAMSTAIGTSTDDATGLINSVGDGTISPESIQNISVRYWDSIRCSDYAI